MQNTKLVSMLKTFSEKEMKDFEKFISSPYFSKGRNLKPLYYILKKNHPAFSSSHLNRDKIFRNLFPGKKYDEKKSVHAINVMFSELTALAEKFMAIEYLQNENEGYGIYNALDCTFKRRNLKKYRLKLILENIDRLQKSGSGILFQELANLNIELSEIYFFAGKFPDSIECDKKTQLYTYGNYLEAWGKVVNNYFALASTEITPVTLRSTEFLRTGLQNFVPEKFENEFYDDGLGNKQLIMADFYITKSHLEIDDEESLFTAIEYYKCNFEKFSWTIKNGYFERFLNICTQRALREDADRKWYLIGSELVDFALMNGIHNSIEGGPLIPGYFMLYFGFKNNVLDAAELEVFTERILKLIEDEPKQLLHDYCYTWINFKKRDYRKTLELLSKMGTFFKGFRYMMGKVKILSLYSLNYIEEAIYNLDSYEKFIRSSLKSGDKDSRDMSFIKSFRLLINYKTRKIPFDEYAMRKSIEEAKMFILRPWFIEEIEKLKKLK